MLPRTYYVTEQVILEHRHATSAKVGFEAVEGNLVDPGALGGEETVFSSSRALCILYCRNKSFALDPQLLDTSVDLWDPVVENLSFRTSVGFSPRLGAGPPGVTMSFLAKN